MSHHSAAQASLPTGNRDLCLFPMIHVCGFSINWALFRSCEIIGIPNLLSNSCSQRHLSGGTVCGRRGVAVCSAINYNVDLCVCVQRPENHEL